MSIVQNAIETSIHGVKTVIRPYAFLIEKDRIDLSPGHFHPAVEKGLLVDDLPNCLVGWVENSPVIRSGVVNSHRKAIEFLALATSIHQERRAKSRDTAPFRLSANQLNSVETEWDLVRDQHQYLIGGSKNLDGGASIIHVCTSIEIFFFQRSPRQKSLREIEVLQELPKLLNVEAWAAYCLWYSEILEKAFSQFHYDAVDEYTIEKYIKDFKHEVDNIYLATTKNRLLEIELTIGTKEGTAHQSYRDFVNLEKEAIIARKDLLRMLRAHYDILAEINKIIPVIEEAHPELVQIKMIGGMLQNLMTFEMEIKDREPLLFSNQQMLLQLLNEELGVISAINCNYGVDRTNIAFAIRLASLQLSKLVSTRSAQDLAIHFAQTSQAVHDCIATKDCSDLEKWISGLEDSLFQSRVRHLLLFWELMVKNLNRICNPITDWNQIGKEAKLKRGMYLNKEYLAIFPPFIKTLKEGKQFFEMMVRYDPETREPLDFTDSGYRLFLESCL